MLKQSFTHKSHKITTLKTDSYKQLFVLITMLLTVLSVQPLTLTMAATFEQTQSQLQSQSQPQLQPLIQRHNLQEIVLAQKPQSQYNHQLHYTNHNNHYHHQLQQLQLDQLKTDLRINKENESIEEERLHKREISWHDYYNIIMQSHTINWYNPCGGISKMDEKPVKRRRPPPIKKELRKLQNTVAKNYNLMRSTLHAINIRNMKQWDLTERYSFLPKLNTNSSIGLRRWHRHLQIYVAAFEYLRRAQLHFDYIRDSQESAFSRELNELMKDARNILCNIEHAINNTTTAKRPSTIDSLFISRMKMEEILKFTTNIKYVSPLKWHQIKNNDKHWMVDVFDLRFTKYKYYCFIHKLMKILRMHTKRPGPIYLGKGRIKTQNAQKHKPQRQQQQQQRQINPDNSQQKYLAKKRHLRNKLA